MLLVYLSVTNYGGAAMRYDTRDSATTGQQALTPLLFVDPGEGAEWRTQANNIPMKSLGQRRFLGDPVTGLVTIGSNETIQDVLIFEAPSPDVTGLVLSLPPTLFGSTVELPAIIRIPYAAPEPIRPPVAEMGEEAIGDGYAFRLDSVDIEYWPNDDRTAFTERPLLGLRYTIRNIGTQALRYDPPHRDSLGELAPALSDGARSFSRVTLPPRQTVAGQIMEPQMLQPGQSITDLALFERPDSSVTELLLTFPGHVLGRTGQVRVRVPYIFRDPPLPAELTTPQPQEPAEQGEQVEEGE